MNYKILILCLLLGTPWRVAGQAKVLLGQYFQNLPAFSPALTGVNDFLDIKMAYRKQWTGIDSSPETMFLSAYHAIAPGTNKYRSNSLRIGDTDSYGKPHKKRATPFKIGYGGYLLTDQQGGIRQTEGLLNTAMHVPIMERTYLSLGVSFGISHARVDLSELRVRDPENDPTYLSYLQNGTANTFLNLNSSLAIHSDDYYFSYGAMELVRTLLGGNEEVNNEGAKLRHHFMGGYRIHLNQKHDLIPSALVRVESNLPVFYDVGIRWRYDQNFWMGFSYRNDQSFIGMLGFMMGDMFTLGYAYEYKNSELTNFSNGSHEVVLGVQLFNHDKYVPVW